MTGKLILVGILVVLSTSVLAGLVNSSPEQQTVLEQAETDATTTPESEADDAEKAAGEEEESKPGENVEVVEEPEQEPTPANRENCDEIRGDDYNSQEERQWFLANCVGN